MTHHELMYLFRQASSLTAEEISLQVQQLPASLWQCYVFYKTFGKFPNGTECRIFNFALSAEILGIEKLEYTNYYPQPAWYDAEKMIGLWKALAERFATRKHAPDDPICLSFDFNNPDSQPE